MSFLKYILDPTRPGIKEGSRPLHENEAPHLTILEHLVVQPSSKKLLLIEPAAMPKVPKPRVSRKKNDDTDEDFIPPIKDKLVKKSVSKSTKRLTDEEVSDSTPEPEPTQLLKKDVGPSKKRKIGLDVGDFERFANGGDHLYSDGVDEDECADDQYDADDGGVENDTMVNGDKYEASVDHHTDDSVADDEETSVASPKIDPNVANRIFRPNWDIKNGDLMDNDEICEEFILSLPNEAEMTVMGGISSREVRNKLLSMYTNIILMGGEGIRKWDATVALVKKERILTQELKKDIAIRDNQIADLSQKVATLEKGDRSNIKLKTKIRRRERDIRKLKVREKMLQTKLLRLKKQISEQDDSGKCLAAKVVELEAKQKTDVKDFLAREGEWKNRVKLLELENDQLKDEKRWFAKNASNHSFEKLRHIHEFLSSIGGVQTLVYKFGCHQGLLKGYEDKTNELPMEKSEYYSPDAESRLKELDQSFALIEYPYMKRLEENCDITVDEFMAISPEAAPSNEIHPLTADNSHV